MKSRKSGLKILISAGPTREFVDPVRFISNCSTGTFGYLLAKTAQKMGHEVVLLLGPSNLKPLKGVKIIDFISAADLKKHCDKYFYWADCYISAAAVGDFTPLKKSTKKIKKEQVLNHIRLKKNPDILKILGKKKKNRILVGFALETGDLIKNAKNKLKSKNLDMVIANKLDKAKNPFGKGKTSVAIIAKNRIDRYTDISKSKLAGIILDRIMRL
jgi:phosphopantothenoylcysteine decarboxylase/phosphopantothenate--cysteine ligase